MLALLVMPSWLLLLFAIFGTTLLHARFMYYAIPEGHFYTIQMASEDNGDFDGMEEQ